LKICFNGTWEETPTEISVAEFLKQRNLNAGEIIAEVNEAILGGDEFGITLKDQDHLNVFRVVAGG
jgi:thiamine biosynthesis protein ThiS